MNIASKHKIDAYGHMAYRRILLAVVNEFHCKFTKVQSTVGFWRNVLKQQFLIAGTVLCVCGGGRCCVQSWAVNLLLFRVQFVFSGSAAGRHVAGTIYRTVPLAAAKCKDLICLRAFFTADVTRPSACQINKS